MTQRKPLPPGWEEYEFTDDDGVPHPAALLRRKQVKATWREAWLEEIANEERFFAEAEKVLANKGYPDAALVLRKIGASARAGKRGWLRRNIDVMATIELVRRDVGGYPRDPRDARESLLAGDYAQ